MSALDKVQVIGDELHFDGELVAIMTTNAAPTHRDRFLEALDPEDEPETTKAESGADGKLSDYDQALSDVATAAKEYAKGGLLRMPDLATICAKLKEET